MPHSHGLYRHPLYSTWLSAKGRCTNPRHPKYPRYGGRGITVAPEWLHDAAAFIAWIEAELGPRPAGASLDRIDNDAGYAPGNLRWATAQQQQHNQSTRRGASSARLGVRVDRPGRYVASITRDRKVFYLGYFSDEDAAAQAYADAASAWASDGTSGIEAIRRRYRRSSSA